MKKIFSIFLILVLLLSNISYGEEKSIEIRSNLESVLVVGENIVFYVVLIGFSSTDDIVYQWSWLDSSQNKWIDIPDANDFYYSFPASFESLNKIYRVTIAWKE